MTTITEDELRTLYVEQGLSQQETADRLGFGSRMPVRNALDEYDIETHSKGGNSRDAPWTDPETLRELYHDEKMCLSEVADELGCTAMNIQRWMDKLDIERRDPTHVRTVPSFDLSVAGYERWQHKVGDDHYRVSVHRLAAVAWFGLDAVVDKDIHHGAGPEESTTPWDNREENLIPLTKREHRKAHGGSKPPFPNKMTQPNQ